MWASLFINFQDNFQPPCFFTYTNEKFSTLPAVIRAYPLIKFEEKFQPTLLLEPPLVLETQEYVHWQWTFNLSPLDLVKSNIHGLSTAYNRKSVKKQ